MLKLYNTESREKEPFHPIEGRQVKMYTCGPTVYHYAHIGNFRAFLFEDILRRTLKYLGYKVTQVMNLTDVDDKTIRGALRENVTLDEFTKPYKEAFFEDLKTLNVDPAEYYPQATDYIASMIEMIEGLVQKGIAYQGADKSVYFAIHKFPRYGCLSHLHLDDLKAGASTRAGGHQRTGASGRHGLGAAREHHRRHDRASGQLRFLGHGFLGNHEQRCGDARHRTATVRTDDGGGPRRERIHAGAGSVRAGRLGHGRESADQRLHAVRHSRRHSGWLRNDAGAAGALLMKCS